MIIDLSLFGAELKGLLLQQRMEAWSLEGLIDVVCSDSYENAARATDAMNKLGKTFREWGFRGDSAICKLVDQRIEDVVSKTLPGLYRDEGFSTVRVREKDSRGFESPENFARPLDQPRLRQTPELEEPSGEKLETAAEQRSLMVAEAPEGIKQPIPINPVIQGAFPDNQFIPSPVVRPLNPWLEGAGRAPLLSPESPARK